MAMTIPTHTSDSHFSSTKMNADEERIIYDIIYWASEGEYQ